MSRRKATKCSQLKARAKQAAKAMRLAKKTGDRDTARRMRQRARKWLREAKRAKCRWPERIG